MKYTVKFKNSMYGYECKGTLSIDASGFREAYELARLKMLEVDHFAEITSVIKDTP